LQTHSRAAVTDQALPARVLSAVCRASTGRFWAAGEPPGTARHPDVGLARQTQPPQARVPPASRRLCGRGRRLSASREAVLASRFRRQWRNVRWVRSSPTPARSAAANKPARTKRVFEKRKKITTHQEKLANNFIYSSPRWIRPHLRVRDTSASIRQPTPRTVSFRTLNWEHGLPMVEPAGNGGR